MQNQQTTIDVVFNLIKLKGVTAKQCLIDCGINTSFLTDWKKGRIDYPSIDKILKLANYFDVSVDYLLTGREKQQTYSATNINDSQLVQGNGSLIVNEDKNLTVEEQELIKIHSSLTAKRRHKLMQVAFELDEENKNEPV